MRFFTIGALSLSLLYNSLSYAGVYTMSETRSDTTQATVVLSEASVLGVGFTELPLVSSPKSVAVMLPSEWSGATSISEALEFVPGVDVRTRGAWGVQTDISIRGGSFEQTALRIDGVR